jgi:hypothetical protein
MRLVQARGLPCEFVSEFAFPLPGIVISEQLGLAPGEIGTFRLAGAVVTTPRPGRPRLAS